MPSDDQDKLEKIYSAALRLDAGRRPEFVRQACGEDDALQAEIESLLAHEEELGSFLEQPAIEAVSTSATDESLVGQMLGPYRVEGLLGVGGMGKVYRARDTRLGRAVAVKLAAKEFSGRFVAEARAVASVNHPHVCTLYDIGPNYLVMELLEGETLAHRLRNGALPLEQTVRCGIEIADALAAAHVRGIIHRDLKPGNIMVTAAGIKVLDFGLAKLTAVGATAGDDVPTLPMDQEHLTSPGVMVGTAAYMSPEQALGEKLDARTDLFSFGVVLYEMATGTRPFTGNTTAALFNAILSKAPISPVQLNPEIPVDLERIINKVLEKDRDIRCQSAAELRADLKRLKRDLSSSRSEATGSSPVTAVAARPRESESDFLTNAGLIKRHKKTATWGIAVGATLIALMWFLRHRPPKPSAEVTQIRLTFNSSEKLVQSAAIAPDGKYLAYSDQAGIHIKLLSTGEERLTPRPVGVPADAYWYLGSWFPDGTQLLANANEPGGHKSMWTVSVLGQSPRELRGGASGFEVSPDGTRIAFSPLRTAPEIWVMGSQGDNPQKVLTVGENESFGSVHWSPDGQRLAYIRDQPNSDRIQMSIETCDLRGANRTVVVSVDVVLVGFCWLPEGRIVYARPESLNSSDGNLWQIGVDNKAGTSTGKPKRITQWAGSYLSGLSVSADGKRMVLHKLTFQEQVYLGELAAGGTRMKPPRRLTTDEASNELTAWTADSKAVLFASNRNGTVGIFKQGIGQETSELVVTGPRDATNPRLSADGAWILFEESGRAPSNPTPPDRLMRIPASGGVPEFVLDSRNLIDFGCARFPASRCVILETSQNRKQLLITTFDPLKGRGRVLRSIADTYDYTGLSPDGSTVATSRSRKPEIKIGLLSLSGGSDREITVKGWPNIRGLDWSPDGKGLYCGSVSPQGSSLLYVDLKGNARVLCQYKGWTGKIGGVPSPDGRYLAIHGDITNSNVWMVEGF